MKPTKYDYLNLVIFTILTIITVYLYTTAFFETENRGPLVLLGMAFSLSAMSRCGSITTVWLNRIYKQTVLAKNVHFYGREFITKDYESEIGQYFTIAFFFLFIFVGPVLVAKQIVLAIFLFLFVILFGIGVSNNVKRFKSYLNSHITTHPNSP